MIGARLEPGDCRDVLLEMAARGEAFDACVTDPPYHLTSTVERFGKADAAPAKFGTDGAFARASRGFMGKTWDGGGIAFDPTLWGQVADVLKPGAHLLAFGGTRTFHRMAVAIEDAGFEIRDCIMWMYGTGFPKSHDVALATDKAARGVPHGGADPTSPNHGRFKAGCSPENPSGRGFGAGPGAFMDRPGGKNDRPLAPEAQPWIGWGSALKPAWEPIIVARKPLAGTLAANVAAHGCGALNIDASRVDGKRWPANVIHDGSDEVEAAFAAFGERTSGKLEPHHRKSGGSNIGTFQIRDRTGEGTHAFGGDTGTGTASRFFYSAKASAADRSGSKHPTVKPLTLMRYLCRLVTPPGGTVLDPFAGSGTTLQAAAECGFGAVGIEREAEYQADILRRIAALDAEMMEMCA